MSLRCSLLGHKYGDAEIEREREEQGSEVVVTIRKFEECSRCGKRSIITENKEVTALDSPTPDSKSSGSAGHSTEDHSGSASRSTESAGQSSASSSQSSASAGRSTGPAGQSAGSPDSGGDATTVEDNDAEIIGGSNRSEGTRESSGPTTNRSGASARSESGVAGADATTGIEADSGSQSAADDDGVILDDSDDEASGAEPSSAGVGATGPSDAGSRDDRDPGEWPESDSTHPAEVGDDDYTDWPDVEDGDEGFDAQPGGGSADVEFGGGLTPESAPDVEDDEVEFVNADGDTLAADEPASRSPEFSSGISAGAEAPSPSGSVDDHDVNAEFVCPECDYREAVSGSSLRAGDICPECARGYLAKE